MQSPGVSKQPQGCSDTISSVFLSQPFLSDSDNRTPSLPLSMSSSYRSSVDFVSHSRIGPSKNLVSQTGLVHYRYCSPAMCPNSSAKCELV